MRFKEITEAYPQKQLHPETMAAGEKLYAFLQRNMKKVAIEAEKLPWSQSNPWDGYTPSSLKDAVPIYTSSGKLIGNWSVSFVWIDNLPWVFGWDFRKKLLGCNLTRWAEYEGFFTKEDFFKRWQNALSSIVDVYDKRETEEGSE